jgi:hypothetical protein
LSDHPTSPSKSDAPIDEFYVGYLPMPPRHFRFARAGCALAFALTGALSLCLSKLHSHPGGGVWSTAKARPFEGVIVAAPYPMIRVPTNDPALPFQTLLLVEVGKFGSGKRAAPFDGQTVRVNGWLLERDGRRMLELEPDGGAITRLEKPSETIARAARPVVEPLGRVTFRGEIIDSKCFLGAMRPGEGKTHKECATLCISGGIPPMFVTRDARGQAAYYLITDPEGNAVGGEILPYVADPVEIHGQLERRGDLLLLRVDSADIRRL